MMSATATIEPRAAAVGTGRLRRRSSATQEVV